MPGGQTLMVDGPGRRSMGPAAILPALELVSHFGIMIPVSEHQRMLEAIFEKRANKAWSDIEALLLHYGALCIWAATQFHFPR